MMKRFFIVWSLFLILAVTLLTGCAGSSASNQNSALNAENINLIFVVTPDLANHATGDIQPDTANLTNQGLQRSLLMATYLKTHLLGTNNVTGIYALAPMTHLQTANNYPDMAAIAYIQQFAMLNEISLNTDGGGSSKYPGNSFPLNTTYAPGSEPSGVVNPPFFTCPACQGLDFKNTGGDNDALVSGIITANIPGFYVFSAPWETISALMANISSQHGYNLDLPANFQGANIVYAISIIPSGSASLAIFDSKLNPPSTYPVLPSPPLLLTSCAAQATSPAQFSITATGGIAGAQRPPGINVNQTIYMIRHAEAHPTETWDDGNFLATGQWRALALPIALPIALQGKISPTQVYSIDPAQVFPGKDVTMGNIDFSYVRPSLTVAPYAIANNLPYYLVADIDLFDPRPGTTSSNEIESTVQFFFFNPKFSGQTILLAYEHNHFPPIIRELLAKYFRTGGAPQVPVWSEDDYDTIWTVTLDAQGNLTVNNMLCEGINSATLPDTAPQF
jgi:hypothetical protein